MFGNRLRELRKLNKYTMEELANSYNVKFNGGLNKGTISKYENEKQEPMISVVNNLAEMFNVSTDYLLGKENKPTTESDRLNSELKPLFNIMEDFTAEECADLVKYAQLLKLRHIQSDKE